MTFHISRPVRIPRWNPNINQDNQQNNLVGVKKKPAVTPQPFNYNRGYSDNLRQDQNSGPVLAGRDIFADQQAAAQAVIDAARIKREQELAALLGMVGRSGSGSGSGVSASDSLARDKWNYETGRDSRALTGMEDSLSSGAYRGNADALLALLATAQATGEQNINNQYNTGMSNIGGGFGTAKHLTDTGYGQVNEYLQNNPNNPYQSLTTQNTPVQNAMSTLLASLGVSNDPVAQQVQAENVASQQSQGAADSLTAQLSANAQRNDASRLSEMAMAQQLGIAGLETQRAGYESQASNVQQQALTALLSQMQGAQFGIEQDAGNRKQTLMDAIIAAGGSPAGGSGTPGMIETLSGASPSLPRTSFKNVVAADHPNFTGTLEAAKKKFPKLLAQVTANRVAARK